MAPLEANRWARRSNYTEQWRLRGAQAIHGGGFTPRVADTATTFGSSHDAAPATVDYHHQAATRATQTEGAAGRCSIRR